MSKFKVIISGGGTGGHIFPAIAIANAIKKLRPNTKFLFVGALGRMEMTKVPEAGFEIVGLPIMGLQRKLTFKNLKFPFMLLKSAAMARKIVKKFNPDIAIGVGGYASGPLLRAAEKANVPTLLQEQNSYAGLTNKILGKKAHKICVAYDGMEVFFPKEKIILTGNPVRSEVIKLEGKKERAEEFFKLDPAKKTLLVVGGSLGAWSVNEAVEKSIAAWEKGGIQVIWQTGKLFHKRAQNAALGKESWLKVTEFIKRMDLGYAAADLVVSRAGALAVSELCLVKKPSIFIPLPSAAEDHQTKNAKVLSTLGAAILLSDAEVREKLEQEVLGLINNEEELTRLSENISPLGYHDAADIIANEVVKLVINK
ncbi:MAG: UDP-N-acetylglucosamine--N-acetylmuramyl-(pentapeptide) pyrophosphoryl-undecaprenol N-acetylglucosamine transferase [Vicingaceae bacterium]|jgi:UDP-N-acetylglucosamine--N-acetylmuramyl-(pentapeptide) pyrophosphoryl-undecaprenol N-acetylglucosamine transferase